MVSISPRLDVPESEKYEEPARRPFGVFSLVDAPRCPPLSALVDTNLDSSVPIRSSGVVAPSNRIKSPFSSSRALRVGVVVTDTLPFLSAPGDETLAPPARVSRFLSPSPCSTVHLSARIPSFASTRALALLLECFARHSANNAFRSRPFAHESGLNVPRDMCEGATRAVDARRRRRERGRARWACDRRARSFAGRALASSGGDGGRGECVGHQNQNQNRPTVCVSGV